jgi:phospholipid transport system transporter-binding protein
MRIAGDTVHLEGAVTMETVPQLAIELRSACRNGVQVVDFAAVGEVDSAAIALLLELERNAAAGATALRFLNLPPAIHKLLALYGASEILGASAQSGA